ncbi:alpha/beta hydrolase [Aquihabitans daechungensis]|uniref:alpha/beta hydrolase n=1 Tax=Aquihabitans daechungensis TaxID=1052257 RepID=UPI003B9ECD3D
MPMEPRVAKIVKLMNALDRRPDGATMAQRRAAGAALARRGASLVMPKGPEPAEQRDVTVPVDGGSIVVRLYVPHGGRPAPLHVFLHGGGWCVGTLDERDGRCRAISSGANCLVASVDYRLAPENAYPTPPEDCYAALLWLVEHADELNLDPQRISVGGESAGANLAAVVCLMARDRSGPTIRHQWLDVPAVDLTMSQPSIQSVPDGHLLDMDTILEFRRCYLGDLDLMTEPYASPLLAADLSGLPPAWIMSCELDKLRDDGVAYARALKQAGVPVESQVLTGHVHPSFAFTRLIPSAKAYEREAIAALAHALHT